MYDLLHIEVMGRGEHGSGKRGGKGKSSQTWIEVTRDRLEERSRLEVGCGKGAVPENTRAVLRANARSKGGGQSARAGVWLREPERNEIEETAVEPVATAATSSTVHHAALEMHRMSTGRRASGFEPQRNTFYVCGRPVQVLIRVKQNQ